MGISDRNTADLHVGLPINSLVLAWDTEECCDAALVADCVDIMVCTKSDSMEMQGIRDENVDITMHDSFSFQLSVNNWVI